MAQLADLPVTLPWLDASGRVRMRTESVRFARLPSGRWRSIEPLFAGQIAGPHARTTYRRALELADRAGAPAPVRYARAVTDPGRELAGSFVVGRSEEIVTEIAGREGRLFGWASQWEIDSVGHNDERLPAELWEAGRCETCTASIGEALLVERRCRSCLRAESGLTPVVIRALRLWAEDAPLLFWDTETDGLVELDLERRVVGRAPAIWDLGWQARGARTPGGYGSRALLRSAPLPLRVARLSGVDPAAPTRGDDRRAGLLGFARAARGQTLVGHNAALYDEPILAENYRLEGLPVPDALAAGSTFDTLPLARALFPPRAEGSPERHTLAALAAFFGVATPAGFHTALADVATTAGIWDALLAVAVERAGGPERAARLGRLLDGSLAPEVLYSWVRSDCPTCGRAEWGHAKWERPCRRCYEATLPVRATCAECGETDAMQFPPAGEYRCRICRQATPAAASA